MPQPGMAASSAFDREPLVSEHHHGRGGVPRSEHVRPRVLGPAGGGDVEVDVAGLQAEPVHGGQVAGRVGGVGVLDQLGLGRGPRGEVQQQRVAGQGHAVRRVLRRGGERVVVAQPAVGRLAHRDRRPPRPRHGAELRRLRRLGDHVPDVAPGDPVGDVTGTEQGAGRDDHRPALDGGQDDLPQRCDVAQHEQHPVAAPDAQVAQPVRDLAGPGGQLRVAQPDVAAALGDDPQRVALRVLGRDDVEPVQRPVEPFEPWPAELPAGGRIVLAVAEQEIAGGPENGTRRR